MTPLKTHILGLSDEETLYRFEERAGMCMDSKATKLEAEKMAYKEIFGIELPKRFE